MRPTARLAAVIGATLTAAFAAVPAQAAPTPASRVSYGSVFVQTNNLAGNTVVALDRHADGRLSQAGVYSTGGLGGQLVGSVADHTASQGALALDAGHLYAVNAGSNTVTVFDVHGDRLVRHQIVSSAGEFPVSVTAHGNLVYVLNARNGGSIQGYVWTHGTLVRVPGWRRQLNLDTTLTPEFTHTPGQIAFTPDGTALVVTTKANTNAVDVFALRGAAGTVQHPVVNSLPGTVPFGVSFDPHGNLVVAETATSALASFTLHTNGILTPITVTADGGAALCWVTTDGRHFFASNSGSGTVTTYSATLADNGDTATDAGPIDAAVSAGGGSLYVQTGVNGIVDEFRIAYDGSLHLLGTVTVDGSAGGEGIAAG